MSKNIDRETSEEKFYIPAISILYRKFQIHLSEELKEYDILVSELPFLLSLLYCEKGILQDDLIKNLAIAKSVGTKVMQSLEKKGFIKRVASEHSQRHKLVIPNEKLFSIEKELLEIRDKWASKLTKGVSKKEVEETNRILLIMLKNALD